MQFRACRQPGEMTQKEVANCMGISQSYIYKAGKEDHRQAAE